MPRAERKIENKEKIDTPEKGIEVFHISNEKIEERMDTAKFKFDNFSNRLDQRSNLLAEKAKAVGIEGMDFTKPDAVESEGLKIETMQEAKQPAAIEGADDVAAVAEELKQEKVAEGMDFTKPDAGFGSGFKVETKTPELVAEAAIAHGLEESAQPRRRLTQEELAEENEGRGGMTRNRVLEAVTNGKPLSRQERAAMRREANGESAVETRNRVLEAVSDGKTAARERTPQAFKKLGESAGRGKEALKRAGKERIGLAERFLMFLLRKLQERRNKKTQEAIQKRLKAQESEQDIDARIKHLEEQGKQRIQEGQMQIKEAELLRQQKLKAANENITLRSQVGLRLRGQELVDLQRNADALRRQKRVRLDESA